METTDKMGADKMGQDEKPTKDDQSKRRRSERLKKEIYLTTMEKNKAMVKKKKSRR